MNAVPTDIIAELTLAVALTNPEVVIPVELAITAVPTDKIAELTLAVALTNPVTDKLLAMVNVLPNVTAPFTVIVVVLDPIATLPPKRAILIWPLEYTSIEGIPEISLTENI